MGVSEGPGQSHGGPSTVDGRLTPMTSMDSGSTILDDRVAAWKVNGFNTQLSAVAVAALRKQGLVRANDVSLYRSREYDLEDRPLDPVTSLGANTYDVVSSLLLGTAAGPLEAYRNVQLEEQAKYQASQSQVQEGPLIAGVAYGSVAIRPAKGVGIIMAVGLKMPVTFTHGLAKGFHNIPRLYGDETVREPEKITGAKSGLTTAGKGLAHGLHDGLVGFVTQPYQGAQQDGAVGFLKGFIVD
ncbi:hypothetical protein BJ170DRAFT_685101 [Xylariales sp. AK1849]|nr:hypothetical protein BJ170DRAFT_685101 [Xylariales sp. AK1849]